MIQAKDLIHKGYYKYQRALWQYNATANNITIVGGGNFHSVNIDLLNDIQPAPITEKLLVNNNFDVIDDSSSFTSKKTYKHPHHWWFCIDKDVKNRFHVSVSGGMILGEIKYLHELQEWFNVLGINDKIIV